MCIEYKKLKLVLWALLSFVFFTNYMSSASEPQGQLVKRSSVRHDVSFLPAEKNAQENKLLKKKNTELETEIVQLSSTNEQVKQQSNQLEEHLILVVNMVQNEQFMSMWLRQEFCDFAKERQRLLEESRLSSERCQMLGKEMEAISDRFAESYLENSKLKNEKNYILQEGPKFLESIVREILIRDAAIVDLKAMIIDAVDRIEKKNEEVDQLKQEWIKDVEKNEGEQKRLVQSWTELFKKKNEEIGNKNRTIWQQQIAICSLLALSLLLIIDSCYDLKSVFIHA